VRRFTVLAAAGVVAAFFVVAVGPAAGQESGLPGDKSVPMSGVLDFGGGFGTGLTECPQAGEPFDKHPKPLDRRERDKVEQISNGGDDIRVNQDYSCLPQNETTIDVNPANQRNVVAGVNDYQDATAGFMASTDNGQHWYHNTLPVVDEPERDILESGDPAVSFDRQGTVYFATIAFSRTDDKNGIFVHRSTNGGFTWSKPCVPTALNPNNAGGRSEGCGPVGRGANVDPRTPGDGVVAFQDDNDTAPNGSVPFHDKEYVTTGPRPAGVEPRCFTSAHAPAACPEGVVGPDRVYVTWTLFSPTPPFTSEIMFSYSDDRGRSWSPMRAISGSAPFCAFGVGSNCDFNQFSVPTTSPVTGHLYVAFENFNTPDENQYLLVRSRDGGNTFEGPFFITPVFDVNYPRSGLERPDCTPRGQGTGRAVLDNICHRVNSGGNVVADKRGGEFADDLYMVFSDNRNGTRRVSNADVFLFASKDGGTTWIGPTRVNDDPSTQPGNRNCHRLPGGVQACPDTNFGADQWWPWVDISERGDLNVVFYDRRLDTDSIAHEWPTSRTTPGDYLTWFWGSVCSVTTTATVTTGTTTIPQAASECLAPEATIVTPPPGLVNPGNELFPEQTAFPFRNFTVSDVPSNFDYSFGGGVFIGDYNNVAIGPDNQAFGFWSDARNGRSSRLSTATNPAPSPQPGRNPICEQSDAFADSWSAQSGGTADRPKATDEFFLITPCPAEAIDPANR
jgi:hypothetical protein